MRWMPGACSATDCGTGFLDRIAFRQEHSRREAAGEDCRAVGDRLPDGRLFAPAIRTRYSHPLFAPAIRHPLLAIRYSPQNSRQPPASCRTVALSDRRTQPCTGTRGRSFSFRHAVPSGQRSCRWCRIKKSPSVADGDSQAFKPLLTEPERLPELPSCPWPFRAWHRPECRGPVSRSA